MGRSPKQQDYKPSETEKVQASVAKADQDYFQQTYDPLLKEMRDKAKRGADTQSFLRGRAQADTMQALTGQGPNINLARSIDSAANRATGAVSNILNADRVATDITNKQGTNVLGIARGQAADAATGLAQASRLARSEDLTRVAADQSRVRNTMQNVGRLASSAISMGARQYARNENLFFPDPSKPVV